MFQSYNNKLLYSISFESFIIQLVRCVALHPLRNIFPLIKVINMNV